MTPQAKELWKSPVPVLIDILIAGLVFLATGSAAAGLGTFIGALLITAIVQAAVLKKAEKEQNQE